MFKNKKILIILFFSIVFLLFINSNVFATSSDNENYVVDCFYSAKKYMNDNNITYYDYIVFHPSDNLSDVAVYMFNSPDDKFSAINYQGNTCLYGKGCYIFIFYNYDSSVFDVNRSNNSNTIFGVVSDVVYSSYSICNSEGTVFFPVTPLTRLVPVVRMEAPKMGEVLQEIIRILPMTLVVVVSFLGLRKAWNFLVTLLKRCLIDLTQQVKILY